MKTSGRFVEDEQIADCGFAVVWPSNVFCFGQMSNQFQPLRFAAGERVQRLSKAQITEANFFEHRKRLGQSRFFADLGKELDRFAHSQFEQIVDRFSVQFHIQHVRLKTAAFAFGAAHVKVAQELHFDLFETGSGTTFAASTAGVE